ncbi:MAG: transglutaminase domain-containing protein [Nanoarchaeota archaeon]|nr:transglutaminase domain-containing protein [Nanoarchaeota archaeon]
MKRLLLLLLFIPSAFALDCAGLDPTDVSSAVIDYHAFGDISITYSSQQAVVENLTATIRVVPQKDTSNEVYTGVLTKGYFNNTVLLFKQDRVTESIVSWDFKSTVSSSTVFPRITENPVFPYPVEDLPLDVRGYIEFTEVADNSPLIQARVNELLSGVTDYFTAIALISEFVAYYLEYNLNYAPVSTPASEVYTQKNGVCDEFSTLMASMLRNVGIPTRFVSGFAFTNSGAQRCSNFGPHSWIEIYVPGHGWLPTDPTYKEFFWVDAGHVPLYTSNDASTKIINASILYVDASFSISSPEFDIEFLNYQSPQQILTFTSTRSFEEVGTGDYVLLTVTVTNPYNQWFLDTAYLSTTSDMSVVYNNKASALILPPKTDTNIYYILKTPDVISETCFAQGLCNIVFPISISLGSGGFQLTNITVNPNVEMQDYYNTYLSEISSYERVYSTNLGVSRININPNVVTEEQPVLSFDVQNLGNTQLDNVVIDISYGDVQYSENIGSLFISESKTYTKILQLPSTTGVIPVSCSVSSANVTVNFNTTFSIVSSPPFDFSISGDANYTTSEDYNLNLQFSSIPSNYLNANLKILINNEEVINKPFYFSSSVIKIPKKEFVFGENTISAILTYDNVEGEQFKTQASSRVYNSLQRSFIELVMEYINAVIDVFKILLGLQ